ncbi:MAG: hypothetical protein ACUZ8H_14080 [Candidatus Anammoxibacter sp.]
MPINYSEYPQNWKTEIVPAILKRANNECEICKLQNRSTVYSINIYIRSNENGKYGYKTIWFRNKQDAERHSHISTGIIKPVQVILTIAHLDHDNTNHNINLDRLKAMCQYCHLKYDGKEKYKRLSHAGNSKP